MPGLKIDISDHEAYREQFNEKIHGRWGLFFLVYFQFIELEKDKIKDPHFRIYIYINSEVR